jgi:site-specific DNA-methyltransferase (adenine-specific)
LKPYYENNGIVLHHGDCREFFPQIKDKWFDLAFADPPYGIFKAAWDSSYPVGFERHLLRIANTVAITPGQWALPLCLWALGGHYVGVIAARNVNGMTFSPVGFGNWIPTVVAGAVRSGTDAFEFEFTVNGDKPDHPSPKPLSYMRKLLSRLTENDHTVFDPFCGSGTTLVAAKMLGLQAVGIEIDERYCEIAAKRLSQEQIHFPAENADRGQGTQLTIKDGRETAETQERKS